MVHYGERCYIITRSREAYLSKPIFLLFLFPSVTPIRQLHLTRHQLHDNARLLVLHRANELFNSTIDRFSATLDLRIAPPSSRHKAGHFSKHPLVNAKSFDILSTASLTLLFGNSHPPSAPRERIASWGVFATYFGLRTIYVSSLGSTLILFIRPVSLELVTFSYTWGNLMSGFVLERRCGISFCAQALILGLTAAFD